MDAQSALRRCIELFSHNTRFFIIVEDKYKLLKPILSRFCEIYVHEPVYNGTTLNLYKYNLNETYHTKSIHNLRIECLKKELLKTEEGIITGINIIELSTKLYEKGYNGLDIINLVENPKFLSIPPCKRYELLIAYNKVRKEFRNEKVLMIFILNFLFLEKNYNLENISFM